MVHGPVREVVRGPGPLGWSTDRGSVFSGHPLCIRRGVRISKIHFFDFELQYAWSALCC